MKSVSTLILAAGKGTRMKSEQAKVTFKLAEKALISRVVTTAQAIHSDIICCVVGYKKESVMQELSDEPNLQYVEQVEQNGTGHAVIVAKHVFENYDGDIFILCGDVPLLRHETLSTMLECHRQSGAACTVLTAVMADPSKYGRIIRDDNGHVLRIVEYKDASEEQRLINEINTGIYCFDAKSLFAALSKINNNNNQNEYYLTDTLEILNAENKIVNSVLLDDFVEASGINSQEQLAELETAFYNRIKSHWLNNGVVIENPSSVLIGEDVVLEHDVVIEANCILKGKTTVLQGSHIGCNSYLLNAIVEDNTVLQGFNVVVNAHIGDNEIIPYREIINEDE